MKSTSYIAYLRGRPCVVCGEPGEPSHLRHVGMGGNRQKENERHFSAVPMCRGHHDEFGRWIFTDFEQLYKINLFRAQNKILAEWLIKQ